jgi:hypothetical protein
MGTGGGIGRTSFNFVLLPTADRVLDGYIDLIDHSGAQT